MKMSKTIRDYVLEGGIKGKWFLAETNSLSGSSRFGPEIYEILDIYSGILMVVNIYQYPTETLKDSRLLISFPVALERNDREYIPHSQSQPSCTGKKEYLQKFHDLLVSYVKAKVYSEYPREFLEDLGYLQTLNKPKCTEDSTKVLYSNKCPRGQSFRD